MLPLTEDLPLLARDFNFIPSLSDYKSYMARNVQLTRAIWAVDWDMFISHCWSLIFILLFLFHSSSVLTDLAVRPFRIENWGVK
jgi:hypothetical protein